MLSHKADSYWWSYYGQTWNNVVVEADVRLISGSRFTLYGLVFGLPAKGSPYYILLLASDGTYRLVWVDDTAEHGWHFLIPYAKAGAIKTGTAVNHFKVISQGNQIAIYVNDQWLNTVTDSTAPVAGGKVGFYMYAREANAEVAFSHLRISKINRPLPLPLGIRSMR